MLGDGDIDFAPILKAIAAIGHASKPLIELCVADPDAGLRSSLASLRSVGAEMR